MDIEKEEKEAGCSDSDGGEYDEGSDGETEIATQESNETLGQQTSNGTEKGESGKVKPSKPKLKKKRKKYDPILLHEFD